MLHYLLSAMPRRRFIAFPHYCSLTNDAWLRYRAASGAPPAQLICRNAANSALREYFDTGHIRRIANAPR